MTGRTIVAMCRVICADLQGGRAPDPARVAFTCEWVGAQVGRMPRHYRWALRAALVLLGCSTLPSGFFPSVAPARQQAVIARWRRSGLGPLREIVRFFESLCTLAYFSPEAPAPTA